MSICKFLFVEWINEVNHWSGELILIMDAWQEMCFSTTTFKILLFHDLFVWWFEETLELMFITLIVNYFKKITMCPLKWILSILSTIIIFFCRWENVFYKPQWYILWLRWTNTPECSMYSVAFHDNFLTYTNDPWSRFYHLFPVFLFNVVWKSVYKALDS